MPSANSFLKTPFPLALLKLFGTGGLEVEEAPDDDVVDIRQPIDDRWARRLWSNKPPNLGDRGGTQYEASDSPGKTSSSSWIGGT